MRVILLFLLFLSPDSVAQDFFLSLADSASTLAKDKVIYDPTYFSIPYPMGDVPKGIGVCTDVVIRAYRKLGIDLQKRIHEDMKSHFSEYPASWGLTTTDTNIDHRRVPNLMKYFKRHGEEKPLSNDQLDYQPGDIICWSLGGSIKHIGILVNQKSADNKRYMVIHNIGGGQVIEDMLFDYRIIGHYRYQ